MIITIFFILGILGLVIASTEGYKGKYSSASTHLLYVILCSAVIAIEYLKQILDKL